MTFAIENFDPYVPGGGSINYYIAEVLRPDPESLLGAL